MKKITSLMALALMAGAAANAQTAGDLLSKQLESRPSFPFTQQNSTLADRLSEVFQNEAARNAAPTLAAPTPVTTEAVMETPEGTLFANQSMSSYWFYSYYNYLFNGNNYAKLTDYVLADDGTIWLHCPISQYQTGYLKLEKQEDGTYVAHTPQAILDFSYGDSQLMYYATRVTLQDRGEGVYYYLETKDDGSYDLDIHFTFEDGVLRQVNDAIEPSRQIPIEMIGLCTDAGKWYGYGDGCVVVSPVNETATTLPEGAETKQYLMVDNDVTPMQGTLEERPMVIDVAEVGNDVYLEAQGVDNMWIKGTKGEDGSITIPSQYLGINELTSTHVWFKPANYSIGHNDIDYDEPYFYTYTLADEDFTLAPTEDGGYTTSGTNTMLVNAANEQVSAVDSRVIPTLTPFTEVAATPAAPTFTAYSEFNPSTYDGYFAFDLESKDTEGNYINPAKLSYSVFYNGSDEPYTFSPTLYIGVDERTQELPYLFTDHYDFYARNKSHIVYFFFSDVDKIGLQSIYRGAGEEHRSDIVWFDAKGYLTGINGVENANSTEAVAYYDIQGRQLKQLQRGMNIVRMADGSVRKVMQK